MQARVVGRVQGVGFRYWTRTQAGELGLRGWVRNQPDGSVEVFAGGSRQALDELAARLWTGPPTARVDAVTIETRAGEIPDSGFEMRF